MGKQVAGFASFGAVVAVFGVALGLGLTPLRGSYGFVAGSSFAGLRFGSSGWAPLIWAAAIGLVVGATTGTILFFAGFRTTSRSENRVGGVVAAGLAGAAAGLAPTLFWAFAGLPSDASVAFTVEAILVLYAVSAVLAYTLALGAVFVVLRIAADPHTVLTVKASAVALGFGGVAATAAGMGTGWLLGYTTTESTFVAVMLAVMLVLAGALAAARAWALRQALRHGSAEDSSICRDNRYTERQSDQKRSTSRTTIDPRASWRFCDLIYSAAQPGRVIK